MTQNSYAGTRDVFQDALASVRHAIIAAGIFSLFMNVLMLAGPLYMLQVYDRVLTSHSVPTLVALTVLLIILYLALGLLDMVRGQIMNRVSGRLGNVLGPATMETIPRYKLQTGNVVADEPLRDLTTLRQFLSGPGPAAFFDAPWSPIFLALCFVLHWILGIVTLIGAALMLGLALMNELSTKILIRESKKAAERATRLALESGRNVEVVMAMGMTDSIISRWQYAQAKADEAHLRASDRIAAFASATRILRLFLQSLLLGVGALLAIKQLISPGMMIAVSIIGGRALGPIGSAVAQWRSLLNAREAYIRLKSFHGRYPTESRKISLPPPKGRVELRGVTAAPPGAVLPVLKDVSFTIEPGQVLGVIGPSAAGKSTLARVLIGLWQPLSGSVRLDGSDLRMFNRDEIGRRVGYLPQNVELFDGTVAQNIARFYSDATPEAIMDAAMMVGVHDMILGLPEGYNFRIGEGGSRLSAGQRQRIGMARAVYGNPAFIVLDEPNANLDTFGEAALQRTLKALKEGGTTVVLITHRPSGLETVDQVLVLQKGEVHAFGPKLKVLQILRGNGRKASRQVQSTTTVSKVPSTRPKIVS